MWRQSVDPDDDGRAKGLRANVSFFTRHHPAVVMTKAKISGNYVNSFLAKTDAHRQGFDEAIMLDPEGYVAECTGANLFIIRGDVIVTPSTESILEGVTRSTMIAARRRPRTRRPRIPHQPLLSLRRRRSLRLRHRG